MNPLLPGPATGQETALPQPGDLRDRRHKASMANDPAAWTDLQTRLRTLSVFPVLAVAGLVSGAWAMHAIEGWSTLWVLVGAAVGGCVVLLVTGRYATAITKGVRDAFTAEVGGRVAEEVRAQRIAAQQRERDWFQRFELLVGHGYDSLLDGLGQLERGEQPSSVADLMAGNSAADSFAGIESVIASARGAMLEAVAAWAYRLRAEAAQEASQAEAFVYVAQRLHALVERTLGRLTEIEKVVEDPDLLHGLFEIDHLITLARRTVESLAVLGGQTARRVRTPIPLSTVLRQAVAEIEQYPRARVVVPRQDVSVLGHVGPDVIHLLAELIENAAKFSPPSTQVLIQAKEVPAGTLIEIDDRGLSMSPEKLDHLNRLLAAPQDVDLGTQLKDGRIGLLVTARLAQRHGVHVELRPNLYGGTQAVVLLPSRLLTSERPMQVRSVVLSPEVVRGALVSTDDGHRPVAVSPPQLTPGMEELSRTPVVETGQQHGAALPKRRKAAPPAEAGLGLPDLVASTIGPQPAGRPALPRRSQTPQGFNLPVHQPAEAPTKPPSPDLMASYSDGVRRAADTTASTTPQPGGAGA